MDELQDTGAFSGPVTRVASLTARLLVPAYALLALTFVDGIHPTSASRVSLTSGVAFVAWLFAESGQTLGVTAITTVLIITLISRPGVPARRRWRELAVLAVVSLVVLYGGKLINDNLVKPAVGVARPNIAELADLGVLGMDADRFYELSMQERSDHLERIKTSTGFGDIRMHDEVRDHWVKETAHSRPSGHALASMTLATYSVGLAMAWLTGWRRVLCALVVPWAVFVGLSRAILRVHWPVDIMLGGLAGIVLGAVAFAVTRWVLRPPQLRRNQRLRAQRSWHR